MLDRENILSVLRDHAPELREAGLVHLRVFGSVARNQANDKSDIDLLADFDRSKRITLVTLGSLESRLSMLLGMKVDLSSPDWMREPIRTRAMQEAVVAF
jgi:predicted nucleotidyltransferase